MHVVVAGNIGSGKTTLTSMLAKHYNWEPRFEAVDYNPYLDDYYKDIARWSFNLEIYFLKERFKDILDIAHTHHTIVQDRSIFEGVYVFVAHNYESGTLSERDYKTYMNLFDQMLELIKMPDLMIYLRASVPHLVANVQKRGRNCEQAMQIDYLEGLNKRYEDFIFNKYKGNLLVIDVNNMDFLHNPSDFAQIIERIDSHLSPKLF